ncbi:putative mfs transporter protein [Phaeoacremonium minimum UCRPA7]|uniref:Putative mfs transporter protein n=1 Tax=Phaeoacremonium minimum (strain UCR-PA7) TaxID=1286976 RepID=R8BD35_PHAM7|nr:putative mfs transporter protein [Phaeoacremonium minimum UCRPA7]EON97205.1 putative mfs transporter protein [Phaeoacremonium minimum UCRPA7]
MASPKQDTQSVPLEPPVLSTLDDEILKSEMKHVEGEEPVTMPESLRGMSEADLQKLETKMVRKMDLVIMPIMGILYILNYVDRSALAAAKVYGIMDDLNMTTSDFATAISILFVGYLPFQIPSNLIMTKITRPGLYICSAAAIWGCVSAATAAVKNYDSLLAIRVMLGVTEAVFFPGVIYFLSACEGVCTVGCGIIFAMIMPEYPHNARLLKPIERDYAVWRLEMEAGAGEAHEDTTTWGGFRLAVLDPKIWVMVWCMGMGQAMGSIVNFFPSIVSTLGYDKIKTLLLTAPPYLLAAIWFYIISYISDRKNTMYPIIVFCLGVAVIAYTIALATIKTGPRYFAMMLMPSVCSGPQIMLYKTLNVHMARPYPKRAAGVAMINAIGGLSNVWTSYLYYNAPHYYAAFGCLLGCAVSFFVTITGYRIHVRRVNRLLGGSPEDQRKAMKSGVTQQQVDLNWRYIGY